MGYKKLLALILCFVMIIGVVAGCGQGNGQGSGSDTKDTEVQTLAETITQLDESTEKDDSDITVGVSIFTRTHVFYNRVEEAMKEKCDELGINAIFMDADTDSDKQLTQVQDFITQEVDAIIICPVSTAGSKRCLELADNAGIPLLTAFTKSDGDSICHFGTDENVGGELAGKYIEKALPDGGTVAIITYDDVENCVLRAEGCKEYLEANCPDIQVVDEQNYQGDAEKASAITQDFILKYPDLSLIFAVGDPAAMSAYTIINGAGKDILVIGYDGNPEAVNEIAKGGIWIADIAQDPEGVGQAMIESAVKVLAGEEIPKEEYIEPYIIDEENVGDFLE